MNIHFKFDNEEDMKAFSKRLRNEFDNGTFWYRSFSCEYKTLTGAITDFHEGLLPMLQEMIKPGVLYDEIQFSPMNQVPPASHANMGNHTPPTRRTDTSYEPVKVFLEGRLLTPGLDYILEGHMPLIQLPLEKDEVVAIERRWEGDTYIDYWQLAEDWDVNGRWWDGAKGIALGHSAITEKPPLTICQSTFGPIGVDP